MLALYVALIGVGLICRNEKKGEHWKVADKVGDMIN
jgi:hypothetical protein